MTRAPLQLVVHDFIMGCIGYGSVEVHDMWSGSLVVSFSVESPLTSEGVEGRVLAGNLSTIQAAYEALGGNPQDTLSITSITPQSSPQCGTTCIALAVTGSLVALLVVIVLLECFVRHRCRRMIPEGEGGLWSENTGIEKHHVVAAV